jgi:hypothetical protein
VSSLQITYFETLAALCAGPLRAPAAAAHFLRLALDRLPLPLTAAPLDREVEGPAPRLAARRFNFLCAAREWDAAHAAVLGEPATAAQLERVRVLVQRVMGARDYRRLMGWVWPGVVVLQDTAATMEGEMEGEEGWCVARPLADTALEELTRCAVSGQGAPDLELCAALFRIQMAQGRWRAAAEGALVFAAHVRSHAAAVASGAAAAAEAAATAVSLALAALAEAKGTDAWAPCPAGAVEVGGWWREGVAPAAQRSVAVAALEDVEAESVRLRAVLALPGRATATALARPVGAVFRDLLEEGLWDIAAELVQAGAPTAQALYAALEALCAECASHCALHLDEGLVVEGQGDVSAVWGVERPGWEMLLCLLEEVEGAEWLQRTGYAAARSARVEPPGRLRVASAKVCWGSSSI